MGLSTSSKNARRFFLALAFVVLPMAVQAGQTAIIDTALEVGSLQAAVEVTAVAPVIATQGGQVSDVKDALRIHDLPLDGRQISQLFYLTPGVEGGGNPRTNGMKV